MNSTTQGNAWVVRDDMGIDHDIMPIRAVRERISDPNLLGKWVFESSYPEICKRGAPGDVIVGGKHFGHGNGHAQGWIGLANRGLVVVADSIQRIAYRTAISVGVPILLTPGLCKRVLTGDTISVNFETGDVVLQSGHRLKFEPLPKSLRRIVEAGGTKGWLIRQLSEDCRTS